MTNQHPWLLYGVVLVASMAAGLTGNVVANTALPWLNARPWLAVLLFVISSVIFSTLQDSLSKKASKKTKTHPNAQTHSVFSLVLKAWDQLKQINTPAAQQPKRPMPILTLSLVFMGIGVGALLTAWLSTPTLKIVAANAPICPAYTACVLVARFTPAENQLAQEINQFLDEELNNVLAEVQEQTNQNITVQVVPPVMNMAEAKKLAHDRRALLVVWGGIYEKSNMTQIHFQLSDRLGIGENDDVRPFRLQPLFYDALQEQVKCKGDQCEKIMDEIALRARMIAHTAAGLFQYANGQPERARLNFLVALHCAGKLRDVTLLSGSKLLCKITASPNDIDLDLLYYYTGRALALQGDYKNGIALLQRAAQHNESDPAAWIGSVSAWQGWLHNKAAAPYLKALQDAQQRVDPNVIPLNSMSYEEQVAIFSAAGVLAEREGNAAKAVEQYAEAVRLSTQYQLNPYTSLVNLGRGQRLTGDPDAAQNSLQAAIQYERTHTQPLSPWALIELAHVQTEQTEAAEVLKQAVALAPNDTYVYIARGELCAQWGEMTCASEAYDTALQKRPESGWLLGRIGDFYRLRKPATAEDGRKAKEYYRRAVVQRPCDPWSHVRYAYALATATPGDPKEALRQYQLALQLTHPETNPNELADLKHNIQALQAAQGVAEPPLVVSPQCQELQFN